MSDYEIGYAKPPKHSQWTKGESGNPNGRPRNEKKDSDPMRGLSKIQKIILEEGHRLVPVVENGRRRKLPIARLLLRRLFASGAQGDVPSAKLAMVLFGEAETTNDRAVEQARRLRPDLDLITPENARRAYFEMIGVGGDG